MKVLFTHVTVEMFPMKFVIKTEVVSQLEIVQSKTIEQIFTASSIRYRSLCALMIYRSRSQYLK